MKAMIKIMVVAIITGTTVLGFTSANAWWNTSSDRWRDGPWYGGYPGYGWGGYPGYGWGGYGYPGYGWGGYGYPGYGWGGYPGYGGAEKIYINTTPNEPKTPSQSISIE
jgi:hypothetical protein